MPASDSMNMPIVMREGKACGLMMTSGMMPDSLKGMSTVGHFWEHTPFWPWREENLSPITGERGRRRVIESVWQGSVPVSAPRTRTAWM